MTSVLVVGGFEPSGHDATQAALIEAGEDRGHRVRSYIWRDHIALASHPIFISHRTAAKQGVPAIAGMLDEPWIAQALADDLAEQISLACCETIISVHPWATYILAERLVRSGDQKTKLVDYSAEFSSFPAVVHKRIDGYLGAGRIRALEPFIRSRCHIVGVAVRKRFYGDPFSRRSNLAVVSAGSDGWAISTMAQYVQAFVSADKPERVFLLSPTAEAEDAWKAATISGPVEIVRGMTDISPLLLKSRSYVTKGGGTALAEGLAAGCSVSVAPSGIFWEEEGIAELCFRGVLSRRSTGIFEANSLDSKAVVLERNRCIDAAKNVWALLDSEMLPHSDPRESLVLEGLENRIIRDDYRLLPKTTEALVERLRAWRNG